MRRYIVLLLGMGLLLMGCGGPTAPIVPVGEGNVRPTPTVVAVESVPLAPTTAVVVAEAYPALPTAVPASGGYPAAPVALPTIGAYPPPDQASPNQAAVFFVKASQATNGTWTLEVTIEYDNPTAEAYADGWDVITPAGQVIKKDVTDPYTQILEPPRNGEQRLTHTETGITIPVDVKQFFVRVHDSVNGWSGRMVFVDLTTAEGLNYEVE